MDIHKTAASFAGKHGITVNGPDMDSLIDALLCDMQLGLDGIKTDFSGTTGAAGTACAKNSANAAGAAYACPLTSSLEMIPTWKTPPQEPVKNERVIVIDAGGTNFRSCLVSFDHTGAASISDFEKCAMPGIEKELSKKEFFNAIAANLDHLKNKAAKIGFCFSYAMKITKDGDGQVLSFSKEIKAKEVIGSFVGSSLSEALVQRGWKKPEKIVLLNDTAAALLAGASTASSCRRYSSYAALILGTGLNTAYMEYGAIPKIAQSGDLTPHTQSKGQIVVCESGMFDKVVRSDFDIEFDKTTQSPGCYVIEKMCSGAYVGAVASRAVHGACREGLFGKNASKALTALGEFSLYDMDRFFYTPFCTDTVLGAALVHSDERDYNMLYVLLDMFVDRCARLTASLVSAAVIKTGRGKDPVLPVAVLCEGTTFYKTYNLRSRIMGYLDELLLRKRHIYYEVLSLDNAITLGTAVAVFS